MALSDERIWGSDAIMKANAAAWLPIPILRILCHSVEAEVRKDDEALIWQLVEALEAVDDAMPFPVARQVLNVARARLEDMHGIKGGQP